MREKKRVVKTPDEATARESLKEYCVATSQLKEIEAKMEQKFQQIRDQHKQKISDLQEQKAAALDHVHAFAEAHRDTLFQKRRSIDWSFGIIGFRTGTPKVAKKRGITWDAALEIIQNMNLPYIRTKTEVDKDKIIMSRDDEQEMERLAKIGITVVQEETFFIEAKEEEFA